MRIAPTNRRALYSLAVVVVAAAALRAQPAAAQTNQLLPGPANPAAAMAEYLHALDLYDKAHASYAAAASAYWHEIAAKRQLRNAKRAHGEELSIGDYVLDQPPVRAAADWFERRQAALDAPPPQRR